jgi:uncharacterized protein
LRDGSGQTRDRDGGETPGHAKAGALSIRPSGGGLLVKLRVKPKARVDAILGIYGDVLKLSVKEAPERGRANEAVRRLLADALGLSLAAVAIVSGETSQEKTARIDGLGEETCRERLGEALP